MMKRKFFCLSTYFELLVILLIFFMLYSSQYFPDGEFKGNHENGTLETIGFYKDGNKEGEWIIYNQDEKLGKIKHYKHGEYIKTEYPK